MVSYGDMTTLLLCFFVFLLVTAKVDEDALSAANGYFQNKIGLLPQSPTDSTEEKDSRIDPGVTTEKSTTVIEEGIKPIVLGGRVMFDLGQARLRTQVPKVVEDLLEVSKQIRGMRNIIEVRGHTGSDEDDILLNNGYRDAMDLSLERARAVMEFLVKSGDINPQLIRLVGCGHHERIKSGLLFSTEDQNRRVEIRINEKFQDFNPTTRLK